MKFLLWPPQIKSSVVKSDGTKTQYLMHWFQQIYVLLAGTLGIGVGASTSVVVPLAKLTTGGTNGSLTLTNGVVTAYTAPT